MSAERAEESPEMTAKIDEEQSAGEPMKKIAEIKQLKIIEQDEDGIRAPNWLFEVLATIKRIEMSQSMISTSCQAFKQLCWSKLHENVEPHFVDLLYFVKEQDQSGNLRSVVRHFLHAPVMPIPQVPPPEYILGFRDLIIRFMDDRTTEFIKLIAPKINDIQLRFADLERDEWIKTIQCLLSIFGNKITKLHFLSIDKIEDFNLLFPGILNQIKKLDVEYISAEDFNILFDWLMMNGRQIDEQKILVIFLPDEYASFVERIKEAFLNDTIRRNFIVCFQTDQLDNEFIEENEKTGEILHFYSAPELRTHTQFCHLLVRCPKEEEDRWKKEGAEELEGEFGMTRIEVGDDLWQPW